MSDREDFNLQLGDLSITSTQLIEDSENFLNNEPEDVQFVTPKGKNKPVKKAAVVTEDEEDEEDQIDENQEDNRGAGKGKAKAKVVKIPPKEISQDDFFSIIDKDPTDDDDEDGVEDQEDTTTKPAGKGKKPDEQEENIVGETPQEKAARLKKLKKDVQDPNKTTTQTTDPNTPDNTKGKDEGLDENIYATIAAEMVNQGIFEGEEDGEGNLVAPEINTGEELLAHFQQSAQRQALAVVNQFLSKHGEDYQEMFNSIFVKGVKPEDYLQRYTKITAIDGIDITKEENQERVVRELYRQEGRTAEQIDRKITQLKNINELATEAEEAKGLLVNKEKASLDQLTKQTEAANVRKAQIKNEYYNNVRRILNEKVKTKDFDGIPVDLNFANETLAYITQDKFKTPDNELLTEFDKDILDLARPENHELKVKMAMLLKMAKTDPQLTKLAKRQISKAQNEVFSGLKKLQAKGAGGFRKGASKETTSDSQTKDEPKSWFN